MFTITERATYYLVYAGLVVLTFLVDSFLLKKEGKTQRIIGYVISIVTDLSIFGFGLWLYFKYKETDYGLASQTGFVLGGILCGICLLCLLGRFWQNKEKDKNRNSQ